MQSPDTIQQAGPTRGYPVWLQRLAAPAGSSLALPRALLVFAHPDDEVLAVGARLERMRAARLLTVTDGAPADGGDAQHHGFADLAAYRQARQTELQAALRHAGIPEAVAPPFAAAVPDQTACLHLAALSRAVAEAIAAFRPEVLLTHPYEGGHPDHDACAFAVHTAVRLYAERSQAGVSLPIAEAPFYHAGKEGGMQTGEFLGGSDEPTLCYTLSEAEATAKRTRLQCFSSQAETLAQFGVDRECFRQAPRYDFTTAPHPGALLYEGFPWGMTGLRFRDAARTALESLFPPDPAGAGSATA